MLVLLYDLSGKLKEHSVEGVSLIVTLIKQMFLFWLLELLFLCVKVVQLQELFDVRHSVFIIGNAGTGKTMVWRTLLQTIRNSGLKAIAVDINPKAVTNNELFGVTNPATREWKDG